MRKFLLVLIFSLMVYGVQAQSEIYTVTYCNLTIVRDPVANTLVIQNSAGQDVVSYSVTSLPQFHPSPDCRYLLGFMRFEYGENRILHVWDANTGQQLATHRNSLFEWSPDSNRLYLENRTGSYLWDFVTDTLVTVSDSNINRYYPRHVWSTERGILYFQEHAHNRATLPNEETVYAFNWMTGELIAEYDNLAAEDIDTEFELSDNERYLIVFSLHTYPDYQGITVYDLDTGMTWMLDSGTSEFINNRNQLEISPDGRYLVAANRHVWVWDLSLMSDTTIEHTPVIYYGTEAWIDNFRFISPTVIEVTDNGNFVSQWDVSNGDPVIQ